MPTQKSLNQHLAFLNLYQHAKNQFILSVNFQDVVSFRDPWSDWPSPFLTIATQKNIGQLLTFVNLYQHTKISLFQKKKKIIHLLICMNLYQHSENQLIPSVHSWDTVNISVQTPDCPNQIFKQLLIFGNFYQHAKMRLIYR